ncbi:MAG: hypothetical protein MSL09_06575 [Spirochaetia bacterium]|nr:hypothetical protein [Spirochaetia bacterium]
MYKSSSPNAAGSAGTIMYQALTAGMSKTLIIQKNKPNQAKMKISAITLCLLLAMSRRSFSVTDKLSGRL